MGLIIPNLDRYDFETLKQEAMAKLPAYSSSWTQYNASDPGVTMLELLAWMADINSYRLNHLGEEHYLAFLSLLNAEKDEEETDEEETDKEETEHQSEYHIQEAFLALREELAIPSKAVTLKDYEYLAGQTAEVSLAKVKANANPEENIVSLMIVPQSKEKSPQPTKEMREKVLAFLNEKKLLTTRLEMVEKVKYVPVNVTLELQTRFADPDLLRSEIETLLETFLHPLYGGVAGKGWEFGEDIHISHIYLMLKQFTEIEKIDSIYFSSSQAVSVSVPDMYLPQSGSHRVSVSSIKVPGVCS